MIRQRFRNSIKQCSTFPGADINSDHNPVIAKMNFKLKKLPSPSKNTPKVDVAKLKLPDIQEQYSIKVQNRYEVLFQELNVNQLEEPSKENIERDWEILKQSVQEANKILPKLDIKKKQKWMNDDTLNLMEEWKKAKGTKQ